MKTLLNCFKYILGQPLSLPINVATSTLNSPQQDANVGRFKYPNSGSAPLYPQVLCFQTPSKILPIKKIQENSRNKLGFSTEGRDYLRDARKFSTREVCESQIMETCWNWRIVLNKRLSRQVFWKLFMNDCIMPQQTSVGAKGDTTDVTPGDEGGKIPYLF